MIQSLCQHDVEQCRISITVCSDSAVSDIYHDDRRDLRIKVGRVRSPLSLDLSTGQRQCTPLLRSGRAMITMPAPEVAASFSPLPALKTNLITIIPLPNVTATST